MAEMILRMRKLLFGAMLLGFLLFGCINAEMPNEPTTSTTPVTGKVVGNSHGLVKLPSDLAATAAAVATATPAATGTTTPAPSAAASATPQPSPSPSPIAGTAATATACGTIKSDLTLSADVVMPSSSKACFIFGKDGATLDCAGHSITPSLPGAGTAVLAEKRKSITIRNCAIKQFATGIRLSGTQGATISSITATDFVAGNVVLADNSPQTTITDSTTTYNDGQGAPTGVAFNLTTSDNSVITRNKGTGGLALVFTDNSKNVSITSNNAQKTVSGFLAFHADGSKVSANNATQSTAATYGLPASGISTSGAAVTITKNNVQYYKNGIESAGDNAVIEDNSALSGERGIFSGGANTALRRNDASFNSVTGITINGMNSILEANSAWGDYDGIVLQSTGNTLTSNTACGNSNSDFTAKVSPQSGTNTNKCGASRCYPSNAAMCNPGGGCSLTC